MNITMPTRDIPLVPGNLSPALAALVAIIITPNNYARIMRDAVQVVNSKCAGVTRYIGK